MLGNESTAEWSTSSNGQTSKSIKSEGSWRMSDVAFMTKKAYGPLTLHEAKCRYYTFYQDKHTTCQQYYESFKNNADVLEYSSGALGREPGLIDMELLAAGVLVDDADEEELTAAEAAARERVLAIRLLVRSDRSRYRKLLEDLENNFTQGRDNYLTSLQQAYSLLVHWKQDPCNIDHLIGGVNDGVAFTNIRNEDLDRSDSNNWTSN